MLQKGHDKPAAKVDVTYTWKVAVDGGGQTGEPTFTLKQDGDKAKIVYSGTIDKDTTRGRPRTETSRGRGPPSGMRPRGSEGQGPRGFPTEWRMRHRSRGQATAGCGPSGEGSAGLICRFEGRVAGTCFSSRFS